MSTIYWAVVGHPAGSLTMCAILSVIGGDSELLPLQRQAGLGIK